MSAGLSEAEKKQSVKLLNELLANSYVFYLKTQNYHWNVTGPSFILVHELTEAHYKNFAEAIDEIAERIRGLGVQVNGTMKYFLENATVSEANANTTDTAIMKDLATDHNSMVEFCRNALKIIADQNDYVTQDLITQRLAFHEKTAWMLQSHL